MKKIIKGFLMLACLATNIMAEEQHVSPEYNVENGLFGMGQDLLLEIVHGMPTISDIQSFVGVNRETAKLKDHKGLLWATNPALFNEAMAALDSIKTQAEANPDDEYLLNRPTLDTIEHSEWAAKEQKELYRLKYMYRTLRTFWPRPSHFSSGLPPYAFLSLSASIFPTNCAYVRTGCERILRQLGYKLNTETWHHADVVGDENEDRIVTCMALILDRLDSLNDPEVEDQKEIFFGEMYNDIALLGAHIGNRWTKLRQDILAALQCTDADEQTVQDAVNKFTTIFELGKFGIKQRSELNSLWNRHLVTTRLDAERSLPLWGRTKNVLAHTWQRAKGRVCRFLDDHR